jgi:hypothetical protein
MEAFMYQITNNDSMTVSEWIAADYNDPSFTGYTQLDENGDVVLPEN